MYPSCVTRSIAADGERQRHALPALRHLAYGRAMVLLRGDSAKRFATVLAAFAVAGCQRDPSPQPLADAGASVPVSPRTLETAPREPEPRLDSLSDAARNPSRPDHPYVGSTWASCTRGFRTSNQPQRDVTRLSLLCAPYHGMRRFGRTWLGHVGDASPGTFEARLAASQCARVFVTVGDDVRALRVSVIDSKESVIGVAESASSFAVVNEGGAFCVDRTGDYRIRIEVGSGSGPAAAELWTLPSR